MHNRESSITFDQERAKSYDKQFEKLAPLRDALHFFIRMVLAELRPDARILCVGAGTGSELIDLARARPQWRFTVVEPAVPMLEICRERAVEHGFAPRCEFHAGYLDSLPDSGSFDAATSILVSHFLVDPDERRAFFRGIAARLRPEGYLVSADLASDMSTLTHEKLFGVWLHMLKYADMPDEKIEAYRAAWGRDVAVLPPHEVESIIASSGFDSPILFYQALLIHAWYSRRA